MNSSSIRILCQVLCVFCVLGVLSVCDKAQADPRMGFMLGGGLGFAESNFNLEATNNDGDIGRAVELNAGYAWAGGFALTGGVSGVYYEYSSLLFEDVILLELSFLMTDVSAWYFFDRGGAWEFFVRGGIGSTTVLLDLGFAQDEDDSGGIVLGVGALWYFKSNLALSLDATFRSYGVTLNADDFEQDEVTTTGFKVGLMWR